LRHHLRILSVICILVLFSIIIIYITMIESKTFTIYEKQEKKEKQENQEKQKYQDYRNYSALEISNFILKSRNIDGGYGRIHEFDITYDLYYLYYLLNIYNLTEKYYNPEELSNLYLYIKEAFLNDTYSDIKDYYYFVNIFKDQIKHDKDVLNNIVEFVISLKLDSGLFKHNAKDEKNYSDKAYYFSTYASLMILNLLDQDSQLIELKDTKWILQEKLNKIKKIGLDNLGYIHLFGDSLLVLEHNIYSEQLLIKMQSLMQEELKISENIPVVILDSIIEILSKYNKPELLLDIRNLIEKNQDLNSGWFKNDKESGINILPTYIAVKYFKEIDLEIPNLNKINKSLDRFLLGGLPQYYEASDSDLITSYYANEIIEKNGKISLDNVKFLENLDFQRMLPGERYYYLSLQNKSNIKKMGSEYESILLNYFNNNLNAESIVNIYSTILSLKILNFSWSQDEKVKLNMLLKGISDYDLKKSRLEDVANAYYISAINYELELGMDVSKQLDILKIIIEMKDPTVEHLIDTMFNLEIMVDYYDILKSYSVVLEDGNFKKSIKNSTTYYGMLKSGTDSNAYVSYKVTSFALKHRFIK